MPLLVALAQIGLESGTMLPENAAALVGAGVLSVIVFPAIAVGTQPDHLSTDGPSCGRRENLGSESSAAARTLSWSRRRPQLRP